LETLQIFSRALAQDRSTNLPKVDLPSGFQFDAGWFQHPEEYTVHLEQSEILWDSTSSSTVLIAIVMIAGWVASARNCLRTIVMKGGLDVLKTISGSFCG
jgi:hypothetical protein